MPFRYNWLRFQNVPYCILWLHFMGHSYEIGKLSGLDRLPQIKHI